MLPNRNPTSQMDPNVNVQWQPMGKESNYMNIAVDLKMEQNAFGERMNFWADKYAKVLGDYAAVVK